MEGGVALHDAARGEDAGWSDFHIVCAPTGIEAEAVDELFDPEAYVKASRAA